MFAAWTMMRSHHRVPHPDVRAGERGRPPVRPASRTEWFSAMLLRMITPPGVEDSA